MRSTIGLVAVAAMLVGPALAHFGVVPALMGFVPFALGGLVATVTGVVSLVQALRGRGLTTGGGVALLAGIGFLAAASQSAGAPRINDFTTDPADPPGFRHAATLPENGGRDMGYPADFAAEQQACCGDLQPARIKGTPAETFARVRSVAEGMPGWRVTQADANGGTLEAIATTWLFRFQDDIAIRLRPDADGTTRVDVRSKSRDGKGDIGANAARIRAFVAALR